MRRYAVPLLVLAACAQGRKQRPQADAAPPTASALTTVSSAGPRDTAPPSVTPVSVPASAAPPVAPDPDRIAFESAKQTLADVRSMVAHGTLTNPEKPEEGDANMKCANIDGARPRLEAMPDPEVPTFLATARRLCNLDVPLLGAKAALEQAGRSPSQASRRLMCNLAGRDLAKARAEKADDKRVRDLDARWKRTCNR